MMHEGKVRVNGETIYNGAATIPPGASVTIKGRVVTPGRPTILYAVNKLQGELVTSIDPQGRPTLLERLKKMGVGKTEHLKPVGRLDFNSEGLVLLTNDGVLARTLELPSNKIRRTYRVRVHGHVTEEKLQAFKRGLTIEKIRYKPMQVKIEKKMGTNTWLSITCEEGKNRQVRRICQHLQLDVSRLIRTAFGEYNLANLPAGAARAVALTERVRDLIATSGHAAHAPPITKRINKPTQRNGN